MEVLFPHMTQRELQSMSMLALAHVGDGVFELMTRSRLCQQGHTEVQQLHRLTVAQVRAEAQAKAMNTLLPLLDEEEQSIYRRGRNTHVNSVPHNAQLSEYHAATGLEALFGWLFLQGRLERLEQLFAAIGEG